MMLIAPEQIMDAPAPPHSASLRDLGQRLQLFHQSLKDDGARNLGGLQSPRAARTLRECIASDDYACTE